MLTGWNVILALKIAVAAVTVIFLASLVALARGRYRLHGRINLAFMVLTLAAVFGLELLIRVVDPNLFSYFDERTKRIMAIHLCFSVPAAALLPVMYLTGKFRKRSLHLTLAAVFSLCWLGTVVTGIFFLPHTPP